MKGIKNGFVRGESGQMTVEFVVCFPVLLIITLIAINALLFFSECAAFDRVFKDSVCGYATSPGYHQTVDQINTQIEESVRRVCNEDYVEVEIVSSGVNGGLITFTGTLMFSPTLFGKGEISSVFGVSLSRLSHQSQLVIDSYKPGVIL